ncbi:hypothetical protein NDU88_004592 [Pleurodeles waltl]|uniref:Uncharacterized protein n=1 Tax=Pleurodeles waltl TaxID=8319 RepID=A0AAV7QCG6_PLEWA|nr:hypothetical protein NDU88_004592 [Pleurodeles waltl]
MGRTKSDRPGMSGPGVHKRTAPKEPGVSPDALVATILATLHKKFNDILNAVQNIKSTLEPKIDALRIDIGHLREDHKKLKDHVATTEKTVSELRLTMVDATRHLKDLQKDVLHLRQ